MELVQEMEKEQQQEEETHLSITTYHLPSLGIQHRRLQCPQSLTHQPHPWGPVGLEQGEQLPCIPTVVGSEAEQWTTNSRIFLWKCNS